MAVIVGSDGAIKFNFGNGEKAVANVFAWEAKMQRGTLRRTTLADEAEKRTGGLKDWTGSLSLRLQFSDDESIAQSAWQLLDFAISGSDDDLKADIALILQSYEIPADCDIFQSTVSGIIKLAGTVVVTDLSLDCSDPERPIVCVANWEGDGDLGLVRA